MAEFCKSCYLKRLSTPKERELLSDGKLIIVESDYDEFCEGCGQIKKCVVFVKEIEIQ